MIVRISERDIIEAAQKGSETFVDLFATCTMDAVGGKLTAKTMQQLTADQITLLAYHILKQEIMEGGFVQLIHNGYGPFIFLNPFAKAMRLIGAKELTDLIYKGRKLFEMYGSELTKDCTDEEFMALYEQYEEFDELDDSFIEMEPTVTDILAHYIDEHVSDFAVVQS